MLEEHESHTKELECGACGKQYCIHMEDYIADMYPVCVNCDKNVQPNPYNPINLDLLNKIIAYNTNNFACELH